MGHHRRCLIGLAALALVACQPGTSRPEFQPGPRALSADLELPFDQATTQLAGALLTARIPITRVRLRDGYLETPWFDTSGAPISGRPLGPDDARVRAWLRPAQPGHTSVAVEAVYRPLADPSLPARELEQPLPDSLAVAARVRQALSSLVENVGGTPPAQPVPLAAGREKRPPGKAGRLKPAVDTVPIDTLPTPNPTQPKAPAARIDSLHRAAQDTAGSPVVVPEKAAPVAKPSPAPKSPAARDTTARAPARPPAAQPPAAQATPAPAKPATFFGIQVSASPTRAEAQAIADGLVQRGYHPRIVQEGSYYKVRLGRYATLAEANAALPAIRARVQPAAFVVRER